ncbi:MAG: sensor histidine kinase, partial [Mangrovibacterium sp.]
MLNFIFLLFSAVLATSADMLSISIAVFRPPNWEERPNIVFFPFFLHTVLCFVAFWISLARYLIEKEKKTKLEIGELRKEKAESELKFLKTQINPHFLFNALNNIYTMTYIRDNSASEKIAMLSDMLRYILYDCGSDFISLDKEIKYIRNYIEFQQLKTENKQNITFLCQAENGNYQLAPMLLIPFIENGFNHSRIEMESSAFVTIILSQIGEKL